MERGNLVVKGIVDYSSKDTSPKSEEQITREFATSKLESYGYKLFLRLNKICILSLILYSVQYERYLLFLL